MEEKLFGKSVRRYGNGFLSVTDLYTIFTSMSEEYNLGNKRIADITSTDYIKRQVFNRLVNLNLIKNDINVFYNLLNSKSLVSLLKGLQLYKTVGRGTTKKSMCIDWMWYILYKDLFKNKFRLEEPLFIRNLKNNCEYDNNINREDSKENSFIDALIESCSLISSGVIKQFKVGNFIYDLKINLLGVDFIIEYHEKQHRYSTEKDRLKFEKVKDRFAFIVVPYNKEGDQLEFIRECLIKRYTVDYINDDEANRYNSILKTDVLKGIITKEIEASINKKVFGEHKTGMRNLASAKELRKIADIEKTVVAAIDNNWIRTEEDLIKFLIS
jgi:hypothetical protein